MFCTASSQLKLRLGTMLLQERKACFDKLLGPMRCSSRAVHPSQAYPNSEMLPIFPAREVRTGLWVQGMQVWTLWQRVGQMLCLWHKEACS